jgi:Co/Zn/Cd efflux system component
MNLLQLCKAPIMTNSFPSAHNHVFLGEGHEQNERRTWMVIGLCSVMMVAEIVGGLLFGSIALVGWAAHVNPCKRAATRRARL